MLDLKKQYRDLEMKVLNGLRTKIENSTYISEHTSTKAIKVDVEIYKELTIINDRLTFLSKHGYHYDVFCETNLETLIDILNN